MVERLNKLLDFICIYVNNNSIYTLKKFEDTKGVLRSHKKGRDNTMAKEKRQNDKHLWTKQYRK